jgi:SMC interacting uncharacterized protein involved in chromosome segregation
MATDSQTKSLSTQISDLRLALQINQREQQKLSEEESLLVEQLKQKGIKVPKDPKRLDSLIAEYQTAAEQLQKELEQVLSET